MKLLHIVAAPTQCDASELGIGPRRIVHFFGAGRPPGHALPPAGRAPVAKSTPGMKPASLPRSFELERFHDDEEREAEPAGDCVALRGVVAGDERRRTQPVLFAVPEAR